MAMCPYNSDSIVLYDYCLTNETYNRFEIYGRVVRDDGIYLNLYKLFFIPVYIISHNN